jgi:hypothetical protein
MSDLEASITNSGGRKARPYDGQANPFGRGGVYPRPQRTDRSANFGFGGRAKLINCFSLKKCVNMGLFQSVVS